MTSIGLDLTPVHVSSKQMIKLQTYFANYEPVSNVAKMINADFIIVYYYIKWYLFELSHLLSLSLQDPSLLLRLTYRNPINLGKIYLLIYVTEDLLIKQSLLICITENKSN